MSHLSLFHISIIIYLLFKTTIHVTAQNNELTNIVPVRCSCHPHDGKGGRIAYLITLHNERTLDDAQALFQSIASPGNIIIIHIDKKLPWLTYLSSPFRSLVETCACGSEVFVDRLYDCVWGSWNMLEPLHWAMTLLTSSPRFKGQWDVFMNLSADTLPIYTPNIMSQLFDPNTGPLHGINFVTSSSCATGLIPTDIQLFPPYWHKRSHYMTDPSTPYTLNFIDKDGSAQKQTLIIFFGSQWMSLTREFVEHHVISLSYEHSLESRFKMELIKRKKAMPDEIFIPTLLANDPVWNKTLPQMNENGSLFQKPDMFHIRFERMDENVPSAFGETFDDQRYDVPSSSKIDRPRPWGPYYLGLYDIASIKKSGALFMRKVSSEIDPNLHHLFPVDNKDRIPNIEWPKEIKVIDKPKWNDPISLQMIEQGKRYKEQRSMNVTIDDTEL